MTATSISVIIPARNAANTIVRQLEAVCAQEVEVPLEVLVVDNGSVDATAALVEEFSATHPSVCLLTGPSRPSRSAARNLAARRAAGQVLVFCDADDLVQPGWLRALTAAVSSERVVTGSLLRLREDEVGSNSAGLPTGTEYRGLRCVSAGNFAIHRTTFDRLGGFSEHLKHRIDIELSCRLVLAGVDLAYEPRAVVHYTRRPNLRSEMRQHFWWAVADARIVSEYGRALSLHYSWQNSVKHWVLLFPRLTRAAVLRRDLTPSLLDAATLLGRALGSARYRAWAI